MVPAWSGLLGGLGPLNSFFRASGLSNLAFPCCLRGVQWHMGGFQAHPRSSSEERGMLPHPLTMVQGKHLDEC